MNVLIVDSANMFWAVRDKFHNKSMSYEAYLRYLEEKLGYGFSIKIAYGSQDYKTASRFITLLRNLGFSTNFEHDAEWDAAIACACMNLLEKATTVVIGSNKKSMIPLIQILKMHGIRVIVAACNVPYQVRCITEYDEVKERVLIVRNTTDDDTTEHLDVSSDVLLESNQPTS